MTVEGINITPDEWFQHFRNYLATDATCIEDVSPEECTKISMMLLDLVADKQKLIYKLINANIELQDEVDKLRKEAWQKT